MSKTNCLAEVTFEARTVRALGTRTVDSPRSAAAGMSIPKLEKPEDIPGAFVEAWNRRDADGIAFLFEKDAEFVNVTGLWWHDREAIRRAHAYGLSRIFSNSTLQLGLVRVKQLTADVAVVHARMRLTGQSPTRDVPQPGPRTNIFSFVVRHDGHSWRCVSAHNTDVMPGQETNIVDASGRLRAVDYRLEGTGTDADSE
jgi:uncharacterized protein (TIGR02246 family)